jgi:hypothetical protein
LLRGRAAWLGADKDNLSCRPTNPASL